MAGNALRVTDPRSASTRRFFGASVKMRPWMLASGKRQLQGLLEITDYAVAAAKSQKILDLSWLNTTEGLKPDLANFADEPVKDGKWTRKSRKSKCPVLLMFGEDLDWAPLPSITMAICQKWYDRQIKRIAIVTAKSYPCLNASVPAQWSCPRTFRGYYGMI